MTPKFEADETQRIVLRASALARIIATAFAAWAGVVGWVGLTVIGKLDNLQAGFNDYVLKTERRLTLLEEHERQQDAQAAEIASRASKLEERRR